MEIGDQSIDGPIMVAGFDEDAGIFFGGDEFAIFGIAGFQGTHAGGAYRDDPPPFLLCKIELFRGLFIDLVRLAMHDVVFGVLNLYWAEGAKTDIEGDVHHFHA